MGRGSAQPDLRQERFVGDAEDIGVLGRIDGVLVPARDRDQIPRPERLRKPALGGEAGGSADHRINVVGGGSRHIEPAAGGPHPCPD